MDKPPYSPARVRLTGAKVFVRDLVVQAEVGVYPHEYGRRQPLVIEAELDLAPGPFEQVSDTVNYEAVGQHAREIADTGHMELVEFFAERLARACLRHPRVVGARIRVDKPEALAPALASVEIRMVRE